MLPGRSYTPLDYALMAWRRRGWMISALMIGAYLSLVVSSQLVDAFRSEMLIQVIPQRVPDTYVQSTVTMRTEERLNALSQQVLSRTALEGRKMRPGPVVRLLVRPISRMFEIFSEFRMDSQTDPTPARVLVADDQPDVLEALRWLLTGEGYEPQFVSSTDGVMERLRAEPFDLLLMDLNYTRDTTSGREGLELIPRVRAHDPAMPIVVMTGWGSIDTAVEAMRRGAKSFVQKPWEDVTLLEILEREIAEARAARRRDQKQQRELEEARLIQRGLFLFSSACC